jgi:hypothetical protein
MVLVLRVEIGWSERRCELGFIAQRRFQERKGEIGERIRFGGYDGRKSEPASWEGRRWPDT